VLSRQRVRSSREAHPTTPRDTRPTSAFGRMSRRDRRYAASGGFTETGDGDGRRRRHRDCFSGCRRSPACGHAATLPPARSSWAVQPAVRGPAGARSSGSITKVRRVGARPRIASPTRLDQKLGAHRVATATRWAPNPRSSLTRSSADPVNVRGRRTRRRAVQPAVRGAARRGAVQPAVRGAVRCSAVRAVRCGERAAGAGGRPVGLRPRPSAPTGPRGSGVPAPIRVCSAAARRRVRRGSGDLVSGRPGRRGIVVP
jgi:hypothetical protein